jgi:LacI family transcriptional regulator
MTVTMKDVAQRAGVSMITVSRVINGNGYVHEDTLAKVRAAIDELQYVPIISRGVFGRVKRLRSPSS